MHFDDQSQLIHVEYTFSINLYKSGKKRIKVFQQQFKRDTLKQKYF